MSDRLLRYYREEISALHPDERTLVRAEAAAFTQDFPKLAERLRLTGATTDDPHVERLLEGVAFLGARVRHRLDDEFPELTDALLGVLYPHYLAPFPSCAVVQFAVAPDRDSAVQVPVDTPLEAPAVRGEIIRFRTTSPAQVWPVTVEQARLHHAPFPGTRLDVPEKAKAVLHLTLACASTEMTFERLGMRRLRLFLGPNEAPRRQLLELLCQHVVGVSFTRSLDERERPVLTPDSGIEPGGFAPEEALLPAWPSRSFSGFRLLSEYFAFPDKFLFVDLCGIPSAGFGNRMEVMVYLDQEAADLTRAVTADMLRPNCATVVNLFRFPCEPIAIDQTRTEWRVTPDRRRRDALEVWSIESVIESWEGGKRPWRPFYRLTRFESDRARADPSYVIVRRSAWEIADGDRPAGGTEVFLAACEADDPAGRPPRTELSIDAWCSNRDLPRELPVNFRLMVTADAGGIEAAAAVTPATRTLRPHLRGRRFWHLVSHLALGHLSFAEPVPRTRQEMDALRTGRLARPDEQRVVPLKEVLALYNIAQDAATEAAEAAIDTLAGVTALPGTARVPGMRPGAFCRGLNVDLFFDQRGWHEEGMYLLASVLDRFLALHGQVNSFVRTRARLRDREAPVAVWPPRAGARVLL